MVRKRDSADEERTDWTVVPIVFLLMLIGSIATAVLCKVLFSEQPEPKVIRVDSVLCIKHENDPYMTCMERQK